MSRALAGRPCPVFGDGSQTRAFTHVDDVAPLIAESVRRTSAYNEVFNVGSDERCSVRDLAQRVQVALGREVGIEYLPARREALHAHATHDKAARRLGYAPAVDLDRGLARMAAWAAKVAIAVPRPVAQIEIRRGLPPSWKSPAGDGG